jgi:hypothetical protein
MPRSHALATLLVAGAVTASAACSGDSTPGAAEATPAPESLDSSGGEPQSLEIELADGWTLAEGAGYQVGLPPGWFDARRALDDKDFMADVARGIGDMTVDDEVRDMIEQGIRGGIDLLAFRTADLGDEFATNFNVVVEERGPMDEPEVLSEMAPELLASIGGEVTYVDEYDVRGMPNIEVTYDLNLPMGVVVGIQNYLFTDETVYIATYTAIEPDRELWTSVLETFTPAIA